MYSALVFEPGNLSLVMVLQLASYFKPRLFKINYLCLSHPHLNGGT